MYTSTPVPWTALTISGRTSIWQEAKMMSIAIIINPFSAKCRQGQTSTKVPKFRFVKFWKQIAPFESTSREVSFKWSHHRILSTDSKVRTTLRDSNIHSGSERVKKSFDIRRVLYIQPPEHHPTAGPHDLKPEFLEPHAALQVEHLQVSVCP